VLNAILSMAPPRLRFNWEGRGLAAKVLDLAALIGEHLVKEFGR
jgi:hypothetical protein